VTWREIETAPGQYDFGRLDALVDQAEQHDSDVLLVLGQTPTFHAKDRRPRASTEQGPSSPPEMSAWTKYVHTVAKRYAGRPVILQVWNEANVSGFWSGTQQEMADLTKAAHDALEGITPRPTLVAPALGHEVDQPAGLDRRLLRHLGRRDPGGRLRRRRLAAAVPGREGHAGDLDGRCSQRSGPR
jgi:hypothetical protein